MRRFVSLYLLVLGASLASASPRITAAGARNGASYLSTAAPGGRIVFTGKDLGPAEAVVTQETFPLQTTLAGVSVRVTVADTTVDAWVLRASATSVVAMLPSSTPTGKGTATLTYDGASVETTIQVAERAAGLYTTASGFAGSGAVAARNEAGDAIGLTRPAQPGQVIRMRATGLGASTTGADEASGPAAQTFDGLEVEVRVGDAAATPARAARRTEEPGIDEIEIEVPQGVAEGCFVPVAVKVAGRWSNFVTLPVAANGAACTSSRISAADLDRILAKGEARVGTVSMQRMAVNAEQAEVVTDTIGGSFFKFNSADDLAGSVNAENADIPMGACLVFRSENLIFDGEGEGEPLPDGGLFGSATPLHAGVLNLNGPKGTRNLGDVRGTFAKELGQGFNIQLPPGVPQLPSNLYLENGAYTLTGQGGDDVGAFSAQVQFNPALWTNGEQNQNVVRAAGLRLTWTGGNPNDLVMAIGSSTSQEERVSGTFVCVARASAQQVNVPAYILDNLPASGSDDTSILGLMSSAEPKAFSAPGLDLATIGASRMSIRQVTYR